MFRREFERLLQPLRPCFRLGAQISLERKRRQRIGSQPFLAIAREVEDDPGFVAARECIAGRCLKHLVAETAEKLDRDHAPPLIRRINVRKRPLSEKAELGRRISALPAFGGASVTSGSTVRRSSAGKECSWSRR